MLLSLDVPPGPFGEQSASELPLEEWPAKPVGGEINGRPGADVGGPGESEHGPRIQRPPPRQERAERDRGVGRNRGKDVLQRGEDGDQWVKGSRGEVLEGGGEDGRDRPATGVQAG